MNGTGLAPKNVYDACPGALTVEVLRTTLWRLKRQIEDETDAEKANVLKAEFNRVKALYDNAKGSPS